MPDVNQMAAQQVAQRVGGGPPPGGGPVDPQAVEQVRQLFAQLLQILTSDPNIMVACKDDIKGFVMTIAQFAGRGAGQPGQGPMPGGPPMGQPPQAGPPMGPGA